MAEPIKTVAGIALAVQIAERYAMIDGAHHKQWVIDQMIRAMLGEDYCRWRNEYDNYSYVEGYQMWDEGITP